MPFFDFHCHPGMKARLAPAGHEPNPWPPITVQLQLLQSIKLDISPAFGDSLNSQSCLKQLWEGGVNLIGLILHSIESNVAAGLLEMSIVKNGRIIQLGPDKLQAMADGNKYYAIVREELKRLTDNAMAPAGLPPGTKLKFIRSMNEYDRNDLNTIHAILIVEGSQNLFDDYHKADFKEQFFKNLDDLSKDFRLFAINVCHFQQQPIANHAFAMQILKPVDPFYPTGRGITEWGFVAIRELYKRNILIDTKHMGFHARQELYRMRQEENITLPLICSHAGVTGIAAMERLSYIYHEPPQDFGSVWQVRFLKKLGHVKDTAYDMTSLNLYDEDIEEVILSGGLIGVSLDQRIIGFPADDISEKWKIYPSDVDYISKKEEDVFFGHKPPSGWPPRTEDNDEVLNYDDAENQNQGDTFTLHARYFINQVLHILLVAKKSTRGLTLQDAMSAICIGSDLDGLVNPIDCCTNAAQYADFKNQLQSMMSSKSFWKNVEGFTFGQLNIVALLEGIFFTNAEAFLKKNFV